MTSSGGGSSSWDDFFPPLTEEPPLLPPPPLPPALQTPPRRMLRKQTAGNIVEPVMDSEVVPLSLVEIAPILRVANEVESSNLRVAYLCRFYAFEKSHKLDPTSSEFKTSLIQRLERENDPSLISRVKKSDALEMQSFYQHYYSKYIQAMQSAPDKADHAQLTKAYQSASVLFEVLKAVNLAHSTNVEEKILEAHVKVSQEAKIYLPYNILPLDLDGANHAIMRYPEIQAAVAALRYTKGLPWGREYKRKKQDDIFDWLQVMFGFQKDNVANQREHLILLLANVHIRQLPEPDQQSKLDEHALNKVMKKLLKNYMKWCEFLGRKSNLWLPIVHTEVQQRKLLLMGLYLLIWGEAANLRFMPECLCYIYHHMAFEMYGILAVNVSTPMTGEGVKPAYGGEQEAFLKEVVSPIYHVIAMEAARSDIGKSEHSQWRNYDDLNEYFWSPDCFQIGWPMRLDADFFCCEPVKRQMFERKRDNKPPAKDPWVGKVNFVEIRSYWHIFRSFDRMWCFFILCLQAMIIVAWHDAGNPTTIFSYDVLKKVLSVFITASILNFGQAVLDMALNWKARQCMAFVLKIRYLLHVVSASTWVVILTVTCSHSLSLFIFMIIAYLSPNMFAAVLFIFPFIRRYLESSDHRFFMFMRWWSQPRLYVGAKMHENTFSVVKYTTFWILLIVTKLAFSYYLEIKPLISPTKAIMSEYSYTWQSFISPARNNIGVVVALWAPIILVYFMDTQIWYAIFSTIFGGVYGAFNRLGEIQNLGTLRSRFLFLPGAINFCLIPPEKRKKGLATSLSHNFSTLPSSKDKEAAKFAQIWNKIITSLRGEDLINNREMNLLLAPQFVDRELDLIQWPLFLLAGKVPVALDIATNSHGFAHELKKRMKNDKYMSCAVRECYASFRCIIRFLVQGEREKKIIYDIYSEIDAHIEKGSLVTAFNMSAFPTLYGHIVEFIKCLLENNRKDHDKVVILFQDMLKVILRDMMVNELTILHEPPYVELGQQYNQLFAPAGAILFPAPSSEAWKERINRLYLLLTVRDSAMYIPSNIEARRRLSFFSNSLFMNMPSAPKVRNMLSFSILTPYSSEDVLFPLDLLEKQNEDGISMISYLQKIFSDEWTNFLERKRCYSINDLVGNEDLEDDLCHWASYRGQTLARTVRGMMYYRQALELQSFLDIAEDEDLMEGFKSTELRESSLLAQCQAVADMKFTYVVSCQHYGIQKQSGDPRAQDVLKLLSKYPSLRVACIDEVEENSKDANNRMRINKVYYSTLVKAVPSSSETGQIWDQVIYRIKLPGPAKLGEGGPENQNHAIIFTRGEGLQTIDMNQDNYMEEAFKMRNLLQEFLKKHDDGKFPTILGVREHIFTENVSSLAHFMSNQETSFVTIGRRLMANPLKVRFHYGHPDVFDRLFHITRGGVSKASRIINLSGDIFAGFNSTLRDGKVTHNDYVQVGKGWDAGLNQISLFEAKMAGGNGEQTLSRDLYRLGHNFDFFRMLSCYFTTIGPYFNTLIAVFIVYVLLYGRLYFVLSGHEELQNQPAILNNQSLQVVFASQSFVQIGFLVALPMMMEIGLERGFLTALSEFIIMLINLAPMFFTFLLGTKSHYYGRTLLHGGAKCTTTGRGFVVFHTKFTDNYRFYSRSHFVKGIELLNLLIVNQIFGKSFKGVLAHSLITVSIWFLVITWLFAPFVFNPLGFEWQKIVDDWADWNKWISNQGGIGVPLEKSWESWWEEEQEHLSYSGKCGVILEILLAFRFLIYHFWLVYHSDMSKHGMSALVYSILFGIFVVVKALWFVRERFGEDFQLLFGLIKAVIMFVSVFMILKAVSYMTLPDIVVCFLAFVSAGWGLLLIAQACKPVVKMAGLWESVRSVARGYEIVMGLIVFTPVALIARLPFVSEFQTHMLFGQAFNRGLQISRILNGRRKDSAARDD